MPTKPIKQFTAWSYSRLNDYEKCPLMAKLKHLDKHKEPGNKAMDRGAMIDKLAEDYSTGVISKLPEELKLFKKEFAELRKIKKLLNVQQNLALDVNWQPTDWFAPNAWLRIKMDVYYDLTKQAIRKIIDYKTGQIRGENQAQLELYAVGGLAYAPKSIETFETELWYLDQGHIEPMVYTRDEASQLKAIWLRKTKKMFADKSFKPTPGDHCRWCWFGQSKKQAGGPGLCKY